jgi:hypothetical protein
MKSKLISFILFQIFFWVVPKLLGDFETLYIAIFLLNIHEVSKFFRGF